MCEKLIPVAENSVSLRSRYGMDELIPVAENSVSLRSRYGMDELIPVAIWTLALDVLVISY
jgi:DNA-directed RNA polymerase delta subunit